ncbi:MAG: hypothetical protein ABWZ55_05285, partial [Acidimicrobiales bacterium]
MRRKGVLPLVFFVVFTLGTLAWTFFVGNSPVLGLDLQGGVSVVLQPDGPVENEDTLNQAVDIIRNRIDALGVAEPDITRQGETVLVQLPGVENQDRVLEVIGQTAVLSFRPVLQTLPPVGQEVPTTTGAPSTTAGDGATTTTGPGGATTTTAPSTSTTEELGLGAPGALTPGENAAGLQATTTTVAPTTTGPPGTTVPGSTATTVPADAAGTGECTGVEDQARLRPNGVPRGLNEEGVTPADEVEPCNTVVLAERDEDGNVVTRYVLGPTALTGDALSGASAGLDQSGVTWLVRPTFRSGEDGIDKFNAVAAQCFAAEPTCPTTQLAIVLDDDVISSPDVSVPCGG